MIEKLLALTEQQLECEIMHPNKLRLYPNDIPRDSDGVAILWAPFDYINRDAQLVIVGVTPGTTQTKLSYQAVRSANVSGRDPEADLAKIKVDSSFRGPVTEPNLMSLLEHSGVAECAGIADIDNLWSEESHKVHFTSTIKHPTFINGELYNNQIDSLAHPQLRMYIETYLAGELSTVPSSAVIVALGSKGPKIVRHAARIAGIDHKRVLELPHPSPSANGAVRKFLSETRTKSFRACRCMLCDRSRIPSGWNLSDRFAMHDSIHTRHS